MPRCLCAIIFGFRTTKAMHIFNFGQGRNRDEIHVKTQGSSNIVKPGLTWTGLRVAINLMSMGRKL